MATEAVVYDPFDPGVQSDPYPIYRRLRDHFPVYRCEDRATWVLSRYADVDAALLNPSTFSSAKGIFPTRRAADMHNFLLPMLITTDPPRHTQLRGLVSRGFTPRRIALLEPTVRELARRLVANATSGDGCDVAAQIAEPLPALVIADLIGVPGEDRDQFHGWSSTLVQSDPDDKASSTAGIAAAGALYDYLRAFIADRRLSPRSDLLSELVRAEIDGARLSDEDLLGFFFLLLVAGHETTTNLMANATVVLASEPAARRALVRDPSLLSVAVEEMLRFDSPVQGLARTLTRDVVVHDQRLCAGDVVLLLFGAANRDERAFAEPDRFDIHRRPERQVAFGRGVHFCLGASLARLETRIFFEEFLVRVPEWTVDLTNAIRVRSGPLRGYTSLPISW